MEESLVHAKVESVREGNHYYLLLRRRSLHNTQCNKRVFYFTVGSSPKAISGTKDATSQRGTAKMLSLFHIASQVSLKYHRDCRDKLDKNM
jgi:hypothetical protein